MKPFNKPNKFRKRDSDRSFRRDSDRGDDRPQKKYVRNEYGDRVKLGGSDGREGSRKELYEATCDNCGKKCDLPFRPTGSKPVYCRSCFRQMDSSKEGRSAGFDSRERSNERFDSRDRSDNFEPKTRPGPTSEDIDKINRKLDKIMRALKIE